MFLSFNLHKLVSKSYLFSNAVIFTRSDKMFFVGGIVAVVLSIVFKVASLRAPNPVDKKLRARFYHLLLTIGIFEIVWFGFRYQNVTFFGSHFVALAILLIGLIWLICIAVAIFKNYKKDKSEWDKKQVKQKYLS